MLVRHFQASMFAALAACTASTSGTRPRDTSAAQHDRAANDHARAAATHARDYDPTAQALSSICTPSVAWPAICWTSVENPTQEHLRAAAEHRHHAADHRAASGRLREAEARACRGIADDDRDISPFDRVEDIIAVTPLSEEGSPGSISRRTVGATVTFRARPGLTAEALQRLIDCHIARNVALGHVVPEMPNCPLVPDGIEARVTPAGSGFAVSIRSNDVTVANEVLERALRSARIRGDGGTVPTKSP